MPFASLHEAFTPYSQHFELTDKSSNSYGNGLRQYGGAHIEDQYGVAATQHDPVAAFFDLSVNNSLKVPGNTSIVETPNVDTDVEQISERERTERILRKHEIANLNNTRNYISNSNSISNSSNSTSSNSTSNSNSTKSKSLIALASVSRLSKEVILFFE